MSVKGVRYIILGIIPLIIFICLIKPQLGADLASDSTAVRRANNQKYYQSYGTKFVQDVVKHLEDDETAKAMDLIATIDESAVPEEVKEFFKYFEVYCKTEKNKDRNFKPIINNIGTLKEYCKKELNDDIQATYLSESILFYCIKNYEKKSKNKSDLILYCEEYMEFVQQCAGYVSPKFAAIMCLHVRTYYEQEGIAKTDEKIKSVEELIAKYQQRYPYLVGKNAKDKYTKYADYLRRFNKLCEDIRNKHVADKFNRLAFDKDIDLLED